MIDPTVTPLSWTVTVKVPSLACDTITEIRSELFRSEIAAGPVHVDRSPNSATFTWPDTPMPSEPDQEAIRKRCRAVFARIVLARQCHDLKPDDRHILEGWQLTRTYPDLEGGEDE